MTRAVRLACLLIAVAVLAACATRRAPAPVVDRGAGARPAAARPAPAPSTDGTYTVKRGDTLYSIALEHGADYRDVAQWNFIDDPSKLRVGQVLRVRPPAAPQASVPGPVAGVQVAPARGAGPVEARPLDAPPSAAPPPTGAKTEPKAVRVPYTRENAASIAREEPKAEPAVAAAAAGDFIWPAKGKVIAGFAEPRSKGIDIDGRLGDLVVAAAAGRVTYVGSGIPGLGKLVVIKHDNGFITVYAHNREVLVKEQQAVARGQKIAEVGATDSDRPKLHFQIRKGAAAV
ncbi:MAG: peptidoglycan DD-metalloendopeptidase family protein, partial [Clostridia bacterium]